jgi:hypothetical protein
VDIERATRRDGERLRRQEQSVRGDHENLGERGGDARDCAFVLQARRLEYLEPAFEGKFLDRAGRRAQAASRRTVRLRQYQSDIVTGSEQRRQCVRRKLGSTSED